MSMNEEKTIVDFLVYLSNRYPQFTIIDSPTLKKVKITNDDGENEKSYSYEYIFQKWKK